MVGEVVFPQTQGQEMDVEGGMGIDALEHLYQVSTRIDSLYAAGGQQTLHDADILRPEFGPAKEPGRPRPSADAAVF